MLQFSGTEGHQDANLRLYWAVDRVKGRVLCEAGEFHPATQ